ncbi:hypothetical protein GCM10009624_32470 [Gordonia sinesedis]
MRLLRTILRPGWIALIAVVIAFAALCFIVLAPWQLGKNSATSDRNELIKSAVATPAVPIDQVAAAGRPFDPSTEWREVTLTGRFLPDEQAVVRLRSVEDRPAIEVLTPFRISGTDRVVAIDRGYVRPEQGGVPAIPAPPSGEVTVDGRIRASEGTAPGRGVGSVGGTFSLYTIDPAELAAATGTALDPFYLQLSPEQPGSLGEIPLPQLDSGPYLSYGLQWLAFGIMVPLGAGYFIVAEVRARRRAAAATEPTASDAGTGTSPDAAPGTAAGNAGRPGRPERTTRRRRTRDELRAAGTDIDADAVGSAPAAVGHGPDTVGASSTVREKLSDRYGG